LFYFELKTDFLRRWRAEEASVEFEVLLSFECEVDDVVAEG